MGSQERRTASRIRTVDDARRLARRRAPRVVFDYIDGAAEGELTMRANREALEAVGFVPRMGVSRGTPAPELATTVVGTPVALPVVVGPVGFTRVMHPAGDLGGARAAAAAGTAFTMSSMSGHTIDQVARAYGDPGADGRPGAAWFQLYPLGGRGGAETLVERAQRAGFAALVVTMDTAVPGNRERDLRHGVSLPLRRDARTALRFAPGVARHPRWLAGAVGDRFRFRVVNAVPSGPTGPGAGQDQALLEWVLSPLRWDDLDWIREQWRGPIVVKGVLSADDARRAVDGGAQAVVVSNHGGRQLDGVPAGMPALVQVARAVGDDVEVLVDGGIRRGSDVVRAVALGARAVLIGRAWAYGLAAAGEPGVSRVLSILRTDIDRTLRLLGCPSVTSLGREFVTPPAGW